MKKLFTLLYFLISLKCYCQNIDCQKFIKTEFDKMTGDTSWIGKSLITALSGNKPVSTIYTQYQKGDNDIYVTLKALKNITCVDQNEKIYFLFTDNTREFSYGRQLYNCKGQFSLMFGTTFGYILFDILQVKQIKSIRLESSSGVLDFDLTQSQSALFLNQLKCLNTFLPRK